MGAARGARAAPREPAGRARDAGERARRPRLGPARARLPRALPRRALVRHALRSRAGRDAGRLRARRAARAVARALEGRRRVPLPRRLHAPLALLARVDAGPLRLPALRVGRGAFNTLNAMYFTAPWWRALRVRRPLLGRIVTAAPMAATVFFVWTFLALQREEARTFSSEAQDVARLVYESLDCDAVRAHAGTTTTDLRQRGERRYQVQIAYGCASTRVRVQAEDGRIGTMVGPQLRC